MNEWFYDMLKWGDLSTYFQHEEYNRIYQSLRCVYALGV